MVIGSYCMKCPGSAALVPTMTCVTDADVRNSHNRQKAAEYLMAFEKCFLASSHTKKKLPSNKLCTCCRMLISDVSAVGLHTNEFTLISGTKDRKYILPFNSKGLVSPSR